MSGRESPIPETEGAWGHEGGPELPSTLEEIAGIDADRLEELLPELQAKADKLAEDHAAAVEALGAARLRGEIGFARSTEGRRGEEARERA